MSAAERELEWRSRGSRFKGQGCPIFRPASNKGFDYKVKLWNASLTGDLFHCQCPSTTSGYEMVGAHVIVGGYVGLLH